MNIWFDIIILLFPVIVALMIWLLRIAEQRLPEKQRQALDQFVKIAVQNVEQQYTHNPDKKNIAISVVIQFFTFFKLPVPDVALIDAAIEACVWEIQNSGAYTGAEVRVNTGPIKTVLPPDSGGQLA